MEKQEYILPVTYVKCAFCTAKITAPPAVGS